jgi:hypothetical protein
MKTKIKKILALSAIMAAPFALSADATPATDFTLTDIEGNTHSLSDFAGQVVVLEWLNHGCPFVVKFYQPGKMQSLQERWTGEGVIWLSINSTHPSHRDFLTPEAELTKANDVGSRATAILHDSDGTVGRLYGARTTPHMFVIDVEGNIVYNGAIDSVRSTNPADIPDAANFVDAALTALMAGEPIEVTTSRPYGCSVKFEGVR